MEINQAQIIWPTGISIVVFISKVKSRNPIKVSI
ncbi:hypothetical protein CASFOL_007135 [Castilleja foliolosa]|uniref:Photosystem II protein M n=1 Tax=Castilleja foliolosa TaxID=1961234 RepID=A0ABD3E944_9LAMI